MAAPTSGEEWIELTADELPIAAMYEWAVRPDCGAVVLFSGTVRDHADGRTDVTSLEYEAYDEAVIPVFESIAAEIRQTYSGVGRIVLVHRTGTLELGESSVVVAVSSAHRPSAFEAARYAIDALKERAPIWKKENWAGGTDWGTGAHDIVAPNKVAGNAS
jgi:molybdopterin synthase catalytic subunit